jgi:hypothetical protein
MLYRSLLYYDSQQFLSTTVENRATLEKSKERNISGLKSGGEKSDQKGKGAKLPKNFKVENMWYPQRSTASSPKSSRSSSGHGTRIRTARNLKGRDRWQL